MKIDENSSLFSFLPDALVNEVLEKCENIGYDLLRSLEKVTDNKAEIRKSLIDRNLLLKKDNLPSVPPPTTVGVDGANIIEKLLSIDIVTAAAVAIEGLTPPSLNKHWPAPYHKVYINPEEHSPDTGTIVRGVMWEMEIILAANAPHDIVFIDGSITNPFLNLNAAMAKVAQHQEKKVVQELINLFPEFIKSFSNIICNRRTDKVYIGTPKYTSKRELGVVLNWPSEYDDKSILTSILYAGEYTRPVPYEQPGQPWHIGISSLSNNAEYTNLVNKAIDGVSSLHVMYYRPRLFTPALRLEVPKSIATNDYQMAMLLEGIRFQCGTPGIVEPYPLFMADRMVKSLSHAVPTFRQTATRTMAEEYKDRDLSDIFFSMHPYRTQ